MYGVITFMAWSMFGMCALVLLAELYDMITSARHRRLAGPAMPGSFNLRVPESKLSARHSHGSRIGGGGMGGLNKFD